MWSQGVDNFLENHPSVRAYNPDEKLSGQLWIPRSSAHILQDSRRLLQNQNHDYNMVRAIYGSFFRNSNSFRNNPTLTQFQEDMEQHPLERNPFVGRSLMVNRYPWGPVFYIQPFWNRILEILRVWGGHVWFLKIWEFTVEEKSHFCKSLLRILGHLPNLKSLHVGGNNTADDYSAPVANLTEEELQERFNQEPFPALPHLETLTISGCAPQLVRMLMTCYSKQIRRLQWVMPVRQWQWIDSYGKNFQNLTELVLVLPAWTSNDMVKGLILSIQAPRLHRLHVFFIEGNERVFAGSEIGEWVGGFPKLKHFFFQFEEVEIPKIE